MAQSRKKQIDLEKRQTVPMRATAKNSVTGAGHGHRRGVMFLATPEDAARWELLGIAEQIAPDFGGSEQ